MPRLALTILNRSRQSPRYGRARLQRVLDAAAKEAGIRRASLTILLSATRNPRPCMANILTIRPPPTL